MIKEHNSEFITDMKNCEECELHTGRTQVVVGDYGPKGGICFVGEAPGFHEDKEGRPFVGRSGKLLDGNLAYVGMERQNVSVLNIIKCRPPENRTPTTSEMNVCGSHWLDTQLNHLKPKLIVTLGSVALNYFIPGSRITQVKGKLQSTSNGFLLLPLYHPAYVLRNGKKMEETYREDFRAMVKLFDKLKEAESIYEFLEEEDDSSPEFDRDQKSIDDFF